MLMSVATLVGFVWIMYEFAMKLGVPEAIEAEASATTKSRAANANRGGRGGGGGRNNRRRR